MSETAAKPVVFVFAGPNGSGKTTATKGLPTFGVYVNADDIKEEYNLNDLEAAQQAEALRHELLNQGMDFSFETVLSTERNILLIQKAKEQGYEVQCMYVLTCDENINIARVKARKASGGHDVPEDKVKARYRRCLTLLPQIVKLCDKIFIYDNSGEKPAMIFKKESGSFTVTPNPYWSEEAIIKLIEP